MAAGSGTFATVVTIVEIVTVEVTYNSRAFNSSCTKIETVKIVSTIAETVAKVITKVEIVKVAVTIVEIVTVYNCMLLQYKRP